MIDYDETIRQMVADWTRELEAIYDKVERIDDSNVFRVYREGKVGVVTQEDSINENFPPEYDSIEVFLDHHCCFVLEKDGKFMYHNSMASTEWFDEIIVPDYIGWIKVRKGNQWGWIDEEMEFTLDRSLANEYIIRGEGHHSANIITVTREIIDQWSDGVVMDSDAEYIRPSYAEHLNDPELSEFITYLPKKDTLLSHDIIIDCGENYKFYKHRLCLYMVVDNDRVLPISISANPKFLVPTGESIPKEIRDFIIKNKDLLQCFADMETGGAVVW